MSDTVIYFNYHPFQKNSETLKTQPCRGFRSSCEDFIDEENVTNKENSKEKITNSSRLLLKQQRCVENNDTMHYIPRRIKHDANNDAENIMSCQSLPNEFSTSIVDDAVAEEVFRGKMLT